MKLKAGDKVFHKKARRVAYVEALYSDIEGGVRLDREVEGFVSWNAADLKFMKRPTAEELMTRRLAKRDT